MGYWLSSKSTSPLAFLKFFNPPPQSSNFLRSPPTGNKKHEDVKLMHKPLIQHNSWKIKKQNESRKNTVNLIQTLTFRLNINEWFKYEKGANPFSWPALQKMIMHCLFEKANQVYLSLKSYQVIKIPK